MAQIFPNQTRYLEAWRRFAEVTLKLRSDTYTEGAFRRSSPEWVLEDPRGVRDELRHAGGFLGRYGSDLIRSFPQATGVAASLRYKDGEIRPNEPCITFFVSEKLRRSRFGGFIPDQLEGIRTDVVEAGTPLLHRAPGHIPGLRSRPAEPGMSLSHFQVDSGTFGCLVEDDYRQYVLSCAHVLANATASPGDSVVQQAPFYGGTSPADDIANFTRAVPLATGNCIADAAIAEVINQSDVTASIRGLGKPIGTRSLSGVGLLVQKSGDMTGLTHGVVAGINGTIGPLQVNGVANVYFTDAVITTGMSEPGDSGSLLMDHQDQAIGLLFAGLQYGSTYVVSWYSPIDTVLSHLGVRLIP